MLYLQQLVQNVCRICAECMQVTFVSTSILSGREDIDQVTDISFASILSREETGSGKDGPEEVFLVSVMQFKVRGCSSLHTTTASYG